MQVDLFSLGIIVFELWHPFETVGAAQGEGWEVASSAAPPERGLGPSPLCCPAPMDHPSLLLQFRTPRLGIIIY